MTTGGQRYYGYLDAECSLQPGQNFRMIKFDESRHEGHAIGCHKELNF